jgi:hypothetical protein
MPATSAAAVEHQASHAPMVWIENGDGSISRGQAEDVSASGARVRLAGKPGFDRDAEVSLRICFAPGEPTVAATARVSSVQAGGDAIECELVWTGAGLPQVPA